MDERSREEDRTAGRMTPEGQRYRRRMSDHRLESLADSAVLKIAQYMITGIAVPLLLWSINTVLDRLAKIEAALNAAATQSATFELRVGALERAGIERDAAVKLLTEQSLRHSYQIQRLEEHRPESAPQLPRK